MTEDEENIILNNCIYEDELQDYKELTEEEFQTFYNEAEEKLKELDESYCEPLFIKIIAIALQEDDFSEKLVMKRYIDYIQAKRFLEEEDYKEIYENYGLVIPKIENKYSLSNQDNWKNGKIKETLLANEGFFSDDRETLNDVEDIINQKWKDKSKMITSEALNKYTKEDEGISFKQFLFCEEYLKTGKVKKTCEVLGIGRTTAHNYLNEKEVQEYLQKRKEEMQKENEEIRRQAFNECFEILQEMFRNNIVEDVNKIRAIDVYLKHYENINFKENKNEI